MHIESRNVVATNPARLVAVALVGRSNRWRGIVRTCASTAVGWLAILGWGAAMIGVAEGAPYLITKLYSNQSGDLQYIELRESTVDGIVLPLRNSVITVRHGEVTKRYVIPSDLPAGFAAGGTLLIATFEDLASGEEIPPRPIPPDYVIRRRFLPTDGGTIDLNGNDAWTFASLPIDGSTALLRSGATTDNATRSFASGVIFFGGGFTAGIEYYNSALDQYFVTASEPDIDAIESDRVKGWQATGLYFPAYTGPNPECCSIRQVPVPVCRYYIPPELGDSHFLSAFPEECQAVAAQYPSFVLETLAAFYVVLPNKETGDCPVPSRPVYRLWNYRNNNHRFVDSLERRLPLLSQGWISEGYGPAGVAWCY